MKYRIEKNDLTLCRQKVIDIMNYIEYGDVVTYKDIAKTTAKNYVDYFVMLIMLLMMDLKN